MHVIPRFVSGVLAVSLIVPALAFAQAPTLGELARREQERRKGLQSSDKVLTNKDLPPSAQQPAPAPATAGGSAAPAAGAPASGSGAALTAADKKPGSEQRDEAWWRKRLSDARESLRRNEVFLEALQSRINALSADFVNRDDPYQRAKVGDDRHKALAEMERVQAEIALGKKQIEEIEEEARKAGVPAGWLR